MNNKLLFLIAALDYSIVEYKEYTDVALGRCYVLRKQIDLYHKEINKGKYNSDYILAHEIIHATAIKLQRTLTWQTYEHEESIAEFGAYLLLKRLNINVDNSYKIMSHYINRMNSSHSNKFVSVYYDAEKAVKYLMELYERNQ